MNTKTVYRQSFDLPVQPSKTHMKYCTNSFQRFSANHSQAYIPTIIKLFQLPWVLWYLCFRYPINNEQLPSLSDFSFSFGQFFMIKYQSKVQCIFLKIVHSITQLCSTHGEIFEEFFCIVLCTIRFEVRGGKYDELCLKLRRLNKVSSKSIEDL